MRQSLLDPPRLCSSSSSSSSRRGLHGLALKDKGFYISAISVLLLLVPLLLLLLHQTQRVMSVVQSPAAAATEAAATAAAIPALPLSAGALKKEAEAALRGESKGRMDSLRSFVIFEIPESGLVLMSRSKKKDKHKKQQADANPATEGGYLQLPGGHADWTDFIAAFESQETSASLVSSDKEKLLSLGGYRLNLHKLRAAVKAAIDARVEQQQQELKKAQGHSQQQLHKQQQREKLLQQQLLLQEWARVAAAREVYEETGIEINDRMQQLIPLPPVYTKHSSSFFFLMQLPLSAAASTTTAIASEGPYVTQGPLRGGSPGVVFRIDKREHAGFVLQPNLQQAAEDVKEHAGGRCSKAVLQLLELLED